MPLTTVAGHPPRGRPPTTATARSPYRACRPRGQCWAPTPAHPRLQHVGGRPPQPAQWAGSSGRGSARPQTPLTMVEGTAPGDALPPPPQRATPARKGARCGTGAGSSRPHRPHPEHTPVAVPRLPAPENGRSGEGQCLTPDTPHNGGRPPPPGHGPPPTPRHAAPTGRAGQGDSVGPPHPHARAHSTWLADPNSLPSRRAVGGGGAPDLRRPSQRWKAPPPGMPFRHPHSEQRRPARAHAVGPVLGPHARTDRTRDTRVAEPWPPAPEDGRQGEKQRLTPDAPRNGGRPPPRGRPPATPRHAAPTGHAGQRGSDGPPHPHTRAHSMWVTDQQPAQWAGSFREGERPTSDATQNVGRHPPPGTPFHHPHSEQRRPARAHAVEPVLGPHARTDRTRNTWVAVP